MRDAAFAALKQKQDAVPPLGARTPGAAQVTTSRVVNAVKSVVRSVSRSPRSGSSSTPSDAGQSPGSDLGQSPDSPGSAGSPGSPHSPRSKKLLQSVKSYVKSTAHKLARVTKETGAGTVKAMKFEVDKVGAKTDEVIVLQEEALSQARSNAAEARAAAIAAAAQRDAEAEAAQRARIEARQSHAALTATVETLATKEGVAELGQAVAEGFEKVLTQLSNGELVNQIATAAAAAMSSELTDAVMRGIVAAKAEDEFAEAMAHVVKPFDGPASATRSTASSAPSSSRPTSSATAPSAPSDATAAAPTKRSKGKAPASKAPVSKAPVSKAPASLKALLSSLTNTSHDAWAERVAALNEPLFAALTNADGRGKLGEALHALAAGFVVTIKAQEGQVKFAAFCSLASLGETYGVRLAPLTYARTSDGTTLHALMGPKAAASTESAHIAEAARQAAEVVLRVAPSVEAARIVVDHTRAKHAKSCECAAALIGVLIEALAPADLAKVREPFAASIAKLTSHAKQEVRQQAKTAELALAAHGF